MVYDEINEMSPGMIELTFGINMEIIDGILYVLHEFAQSDDTWDSDCERIRPLLLNTINRVDECQVLFKRLMALAVDHGVKISDGAAPAQEVH
ncbi:MAG: hypothetical protein HQK57_03940 [Deltaproteobacteria bacterium]|nr:hypothetical protein [Deltaproteobacteria bacterium]